MAKSIWKHFVNINKEKQFRFYPNHDRFDHISRLKINSKNNKYNTALPVKRNDKCSNVNSHGNDDVKFNFNKNFIQFSTIQHCQSIRIPIHLPPASHFCTWFSRWVCSEQSGRMAKNSNHYRGNLVCNNHSENGRENYSKIRFCSCQLHLPVHMDIYTECLWDFWFDSNRDSRMLTVYRSILRTNSHR